MMGRNTSSFAAALALSLGLAAAGTAGALDVDDSASNLESGAALMSRAAEVLGHGVDGAVRTLRVRYTLSLDLTGQATTMVQEMAFALPDKLRQTMATPMGEQTLVFHGTEGVMSAGGMTQPISGERVEDGLRELGRQLLVLTSHAGNPALEAIAAGTDAVEGRACGIVAVRFMETESRLCIGTDGRVLQQTYQGKHPMRQTPGLMQVRYTDYAPVGERLVPHKQTVSFEGEQLAVVTLESIEINPELDPSLFAIPAPR